MRPETTRRSTDVRQQNPFIDKPSFAFGVYLEIATRMMERNHFPTLITHGCAARTRQGIGRVLQAMVPNVDNLVSRQTDLLWAALGNNAISVSLCLV